MHLAQPPTRASDRGLCGGSDDDCVLFMRDARRGSLSSNELQQARHKDYWALSVNNSKCYKSLLSPKPNPPRAAEDVTAPRANPPDLDLRITRQQVLPYRAPSSTIMNKLRLASSLRLSHHTTRGTALLAGCKSLAVFRSRMTSSISATSNGPQNPS